MASKRWLNIVVDGNIALQPHWHDIVSNHLESIIRSFRGDIQEEAYLGLVLYNASTELEAGLDIQFINWTKDADKFLENLSHLTFNGNDVNNCNMAEGLAEALVMYPKPSDIMHAIDYYNAERHCILVASGDPTPKRMMLCLPMINQQGNLVGQRLMAREADFLNVSQMFPLLKISLSVITPNSQPIFDDIFNLGNGASLSNGPVSSYSNASNTSSPACQVSIGERIRRASRTESASSQPLNFQELVFPNEVSPKETPLASFGHSQMNVCDDIMTDLSAGTDTFAPSRRSKTMVTFDEDNLKRLFELEQQLSFDCFNNSNGQEKGQVESSTSKMIPIEALKAVESELEQALKVGSNKTSNVQAHTSNVVGECSTKILQGITSTNNILSPTLSLENPSGSVGLVSQQHHPRVGEECSTRLFQGITSGNSILCPILSSENPSSSNALVPQQQPLSLGEQYSTRLFQELTMNKSILNSMLISDNPSSGEEEYSTRLLGSITTNKSKLNLMWSSDNPCSSSAALVTQQHCPSVGGEYSTRLVQGTTSHNRVLNPILNFENPSSSAVSIPQQHPPSVGEEYSTRLLHGITSNKSVLNPMLSSGNPSSSAGLLPQKRPSSVGEEYSTSLLHGITSNKSIRNSMLSLENSSNSKFDGLLPQQPSSSLWPTEPQALDRQHGLMNNATQISTGASYSDDIFSNTMVNSLLQFQPYALQNQFPVPQIASSRTATRPMENFSENQYQSNRMTSFGALNSPTFGTFNHQRKLLPVPTIDKLRYYVHTWEGFLTGKIHANCAFVIKAKAFRSPKTPLMLTVNWKNKLEILNFIPEKAVSDTKSIYHPIDYVFFHVAKYNNVDLYKYLKSSKLCGKVDLSFESVIISPTKKENYFLGTVFDRSAVFIEQH